MVTFYLSVLSDGESASVMLWLDENIRGVLDFCARNITFI